MKKALKKAAKRRPAPKKAVRKAVAPKLKKAVRKAAAPKLKKARPKMKTAKPVSSRKPLHRAASAGKAKQKLIKRTVKASRKVPKKQALRQEFFEKVTQHIVEGPAPQPVKPYPVVEGADSERIKMLLPLLRDLAKRQAITDWRINMAHVRSANLYATGLSLDNETTALREDVVVTVYRRFPDGTMGDAQTPIVTTDPLAARQQLLDAAQVCEHSRKPAFTLPRPAENIAFPQSCDQQMLLAIFSGDGLRVPREAFARIKAAMAAIKDVKANAVEILASASAVRVLNSSGVDVSYHRTSLYFEIVMSAKEQEFRWNALAVSPEQINFALELPRQAQIARDAVMAQPADEFAGDVLLSQQPLVDFFAPADTHNPLVLHSFARLRLMGLSRMEPAKPVGHIRGEPFTLCANPAVPLGLLSGPVDEEGTPLQQVEIIRNGVFQNHVATARYGQQLGVPVTGNMSNVQIASGATREEHLRGNNYFEIIAFSWFNPDPFSGDFSAEIRLGYRWINGKKTPVRGGHFVGNVFQNLMNARFSREVMQSGRYYGPRAVLFKEAKIMK